MNITAVIPARYAASRFPGKLLEKIGNQSIIATTYRAACAIRCFDQVIVATDDQRIYDEIKNIGGNVCMTSSHHQSGSDRIAEVMAEQTADIVVNIQGDEPFIQKKSMELLLDIFKKDTEQSVDVASLMEILSEKDEIRNPNNVKVVVDKNYNALYFSRAPIPYPREIQSNTLYYKHIGVYAYRKSALMAFADLPRGFLEPTEKLEQLRYLENGFRLRLAVTDLPTIGIDTPQDLEKARKMIAEERKFNSNVK